ncbi:MAG: hypothetical protein NTZ46_12050 [Verrucomicrobia bacterium]|nr:hypothetical protein [Verrucomicrobiota bacterium]
MKSKHIAFALILGAYIAIGMAFVGCATVRPAPDAAGDATARAVTSTSAAKAAIIHAKQEIAKLQAPAAQAALNEAVAQLNETQEQLAVAASASAMASRRVGEISQALDIATAKSNRLKAARDFWRTATWKLALLSLALGIWTFRRPLLALCGVPIL